MEKGEILGPRSTLPETLAQLLNFLPPCIDLSYKAKASFPNIFVIMLQRGLFDETAWTGANNILFFLFTLHPDFKAMLHDVPLLLKTYFFSLCLPRYD